MPIAPPLGKEGLFVNILSVKSLPERNYGVLVAN